MREKRKFLLVDILLIIMMVAPIVAGMVLKVLTNPPSEGISISGALAYFTVKMPFMGDLPITESLVNSWLVMISITGLCLYLTHGIKVHADTKRQHAVEWIVTKCKDLVNENMGEYFFSFAPFIASIIILAAFSSLITLVGLYPPTSDMSITAGWAILVFVLITYYKCKCGPGYYLKGLCEPVPFLAPFNVLGEISTPVSMAFRMYGNIISGSVVAVLVAAGLKGLSALLLGWLPGFLGEFPFLQIGIPAVLSIYFDVFSGCLQAYIFAMLTMMYVSGGFPAEEYERRKEIKAAKVNK